MPKFSLKNPETLIQIMSVGMLVLLAGVIFLGFESLHMQKQIKDLNNTVSNQPLPSSGITTDDVSNAVHDEINVAGGVNDKLDDIKLLLQH